MRMADSCLDEKRFPYTKKLTIDVSLELSNENLLNDLRSLTRREPRSKEKQLDSVIAYPETYIFAQFASKVYKDKEKKETHADYEKRLKLPLGWKLLTTARSKALLGTVWGYFGAAFWHPARRRIVIAHRGTKPTNLDALRADLNGILANKYVKQMNAACTFVHKLYQAVIELVKETNCDFEIYFTGHSLGAWLAQITTFSLKYLKLQDASIFLKNPSDGCHAHTEVFDSPGCSDMLLKMTKDFDVRYSGKTTKVDNLDITTYLSSPNMVNCCNLHIGRLFRVYPEITSDTYLKYTLSSHNMDGILETFEMSSKIKRVINWPKIKIEFWQWKIWETPKKLLGKEYKDFFDWAKDTNNYDPKTDDMSIEVSLPNSDETHKYSLVTYQVKEICRVECGVSTFTDLEWKFLQRYQQLKIIPNSIFEGIELSDEFRSKVMKRLQQLIVQDDSVTLPSECEYDIKQLVPYVKKLLKLFPNLHQQAESALTDFEVRKQIYQNISETYRQKIFDFIKILVSEFDWVELRDFLENDIKQVCQITTSFGTELTMAKVLTKIDLIIRKFLIFAFELQNVLTTEIFFSLTEFLKNINLETLILLECKVSLSSHPDCKEFVQNLIDQVRNLSKIKLILITNEKDELNQNGYLTLIKHGEIKWNELSNEAQKEIVTKPLIEFQGNQNKISLEHFFGKLNPGEFQVILDSETLSKFVRNEAVTVGKELDSLGDVLDYYNPREFKYNPFIKANILDDLTPNELLTVSQQKIDTLHNSLLQKIGILVESNCDQDFQTLCDQNPRKNIHWLKLHSDTKLIWYQTKGNLDHLRNYVDLEECLQFSEDDVLENFSSSKTLIISDTPGMGKSTVLSVLAEKIKAKPSNYWVIRVNLNACTKTLETAKENHVSIKTSTEASRFLMEQILPCSPSTILSSSLEMKLFERALLTRGGVVLLFDGFDEISPDYENTITTLLETLLRTTRIEKLVLTTRPHTKEQLENSLGCWSHTMVPFTKQNQINFVVQFFQKHFNVKVIGTVNLRKYAEESIESLTRSINDLQRQLMGIPLQCRLLAEYMLDKITEGDYAAIENLSLVELYEAFVERKMRIYHQEKSRDADGNISATNAKKIMEAGILNLHRQYALQLTLPKNVWEELDYPEIDEAKEAFETEVLKAGLVYKSSRDNPQFIHRTFAEYFVFNYVMRLAESESKRPKKLSLLTREILLKDEFIVIRVFLDVLIQNDKRLRETANVLQSFVQHLSTKWLENPNSCVNSSRETILHVLLREKHRYMLKKLFEILSNDQLLQPEVSRSLVLWVTNRGKTALYIAVWNGDVDSVKALLNHGAEVNVCSEGGFSPLYLACQHGNLDIVKMLIEQGSNVNAFTDHNKWSPLMVASLCGHSEVVKYLLDKEADTEIRSDIGWTALHSACQNDHLDIVTSLINAGAIVDCRSDEEWTPLHLVSFYGHIRIANVLIENEANVNALTELNFTPLHYASDKNHSEIVRALLAKGSNVNALTKNDPPVSHRDSPLHLAAQEGHARVAEILLSHGANPMIKNSHDETPLDRARLCEHDEMVQLLKSHVN